MPPGTPFPGQSAASDRYQTTRPTGSPGSSGPASSAPTGNCTAGTTPPTRSAPNPPATAPDKRAAWHAALAALGPADGPDVRGLPDGLLLHLRDTYPIETAWAPRWVGDELRQVRRGADDARLSAIRARAEAAAARRNGDAGQAARHESLAVSYQAMERAYRDRETVFAAVMDDRARWERATT